MCVCNLADGDIGDTSKYICIYAGMGLGGQMFALSNESWMGRGGGGALRVVKAHIELLAARRWGCFPRQMQIKSRAHFWPININFAKASDTRARAIYAAFAFE